MTKLAPQCTCKSQDRFLPSCPYATQEEIQLWEADQYLKQVWTTQETFAEKLLG